MKTRRFIGKWFIVILIAAIGIGTFAALTMSNEKDKEANEARPSSYLTNQRQHDIDLEYLAKLTGEYRAAGEDDADWHLSVQADHEDLGPYLSVHDSGTGDTGFEGRIMYLKDDIIIVEIDQDLYEGMPDGWEPEGEGKYAILDCVKTDDGVRLGYRGAAIEFE